MTYKEMEAEQRKAYCHSASKICTELCQPCQCGNEMVLVTVELTEQDYIRVTVQCEHCGKGISNGATLKYSNPDKVVAVTARDWNKYFGKRDNEPTELEKALDYFGYPPKTPYDEIVLKALRAYGKEE